MGGQGEDGWEYYSEEYELTASDDWRGDQHLEDWPETLAGPEYWLYKRDLEQGN